MELDAFPWLLTPGANWINWVKLRPFRGRSTTCCSVRRLLTSDDAVSMVSTLLVTVTLCVSIPTSIGRFNSRRWPTANSKSWVFCLKPVSFTVIEYLPGGTATKSNSPTDDDEAWRTTAVERLRSSIEAFGTTEPEASVTTPTTDPASNWAQASVEANKARQTTDKNVRFTIGRP